MKSSVVILWRSDQITTVPIVGGRLGTNNIVANPMSNKFGNQVSAELMFDWSITFKEVISCTDFMLHQTYKNQHYDYRTIFSAWQDSGAEQLLPVS